ncbi:MAG: hypothetical protein ABI442_00330 [Gemmatimonadaceae bacterium]
MISRRVAGLLTAAFMLHLNIAAGDVHCATHMPSDHAAAGHTAPPPMDMTRPAPASGNGDVRDQHPCEIPVQVDCCQGLMSCSASFVGSAAGAVPLPMSTAIVPTTAVDAPLSLILAPDPPPPKA